MSNLTNKPVGGPPSNGFNLDKANAKIFGVCGGIANYFKIDPLWVRIGFVGTAFFTVGTALLIYLAIALIAD